MRADLCVGQGCRGIPHLVESKQASADHTDDRCIARLKRAFDGKRRSEISASDLDGYKRDRVDAGVTVMVNRELACQKMLYDRWREWGKYEGDNPAAHVRQLRESPGRIRWSPDRPERLREVMEDADGATRPESFKAPSKSTAGGRHRTLSMSSAAAGPRFRWSSATRI
jgi:hypothetical protein